MSASQKALEAIKVSEKGLPTTWPQCADAKSARQRHIRDTRIYKDWLAAPDKEGEIALLCEKWGLTEGRVRSIIERVHSGERSVVPFMAAELTVLKQVKREEVLYDGQAYRAEIDEQIKKFEAARDAGTKWVDVEVNEEDGEHGSVKTKRRAIDGVIKELYAELNKSHAIEGEALKIYIPQETTNLNVNLTANASREFVEQFDKLRNLPKSRVVDAESEEIK